MNRIMKKLASGFLVLGFLVGSSLMFDTATQAQNWPRDRYGNQYQRDRYYGSRYQYQMGYRAGVSRGRTDARFHRGMRPNTYRGSLAYRQGFRQGYTNAYRETVAILRRY